MAQQPERPLRTLFLLEDLCYGGTQKQNLALACRLDRDLFAPGILTLTGPTDLDAAARQADVPLYHLGETRKVPSLFFARLGGMLKKLKPDILVPCTALPNIWGRLWGRFLNIPVIVGTVRGGGAPKRQHEWLLRRFASGIVCNSKALAQIMAGMGVPAACLRYIPNGVDTEHFFPHERGQAQNQVIVCVARLARDKDHLTLLKAFAMIAADFPRASLRIVGEGPEEGSLKNYLEQNFPAKLAGRVVFAGASADPALELDNADIFALSSIREGQPNVILEAMACGLPVCATSVGGIPEIVTTNGLLAPARDAGAFAANLRTLLQNPQLGAQMGQYGREMAQRDFSFASMVQKHQDFFQELWQNAKNSLD